MKGKHMQYHNTREAHITDILNFCLYFINIKCCGKCLARFSDAQEKCDTVSTVPVTDSQFSLKIHFICRYILKIENYAFSELSFSCVACKGPFVRQAIFNIKKMVGRTCNDPSEKFCILSLDILHTKSEFFSLLSL